MGVPRTGFNTNLGGLYDFLDNQFPAALLRGGDVFWVNSATGSDDYPNWGTSRDAPMATLDYAIGKCAANHGDIVFVMENHAETITGVGGIAFDVAGITVIGLGTYNQRPRFLMDGGTTVTAVISAADVTVKNMVFAAGHASVVACFDVTATGALLKDLDFRNNTSTEMFVTPIKSTSTTDGAANGLKVIGCSWYDIENTAKEFIELNADITNLVVAHNRVCLPAGTAAPLILQATGKDMRGATIVWNYVQNASTANDLLVSNDTSDNTGIIAHNRCKHADVTGAHTLMTAVGLAPFDNLSNSTATTSGFVLPAIDADS